jgi:hypothetical protein
MNSTTTSSMPTTYVDAASMAQPASAARAWFTRAGLAVWRVLEAVGHARALRELRSLHDRWEISDPELARQMNGATQFLLQAPHR